MSDKDDLTEIEVVHNATVKSNLAERNQQADLPKLRPKQARFIAEYLKSGNATQAMIKAGYSTVAPSQNGHRQLQRKAIQSHLAHHTDLAESVLVGTMKDWQGSKVPRKRELALKAASYVHDKVHGKAKQSVSVTSSVVAINIDLTA